MTAGSTQVVRRRLVPAELRHLELEPAKLRDGGYAAAAMGAATTFGAAVALKIPALLVAVPVIAVGAYAVERLFVAKRSTGQTPTAMLITPWGIVAGGAIPWSAIEAIHHAELVQPQFQSRSGEEQVAHSRLTVRAGGAVMVAERKYESMLDVLDAVLGQYAAEGSRPVALDLDEHGATSLPAQPGATRDVLAAARALLQSDAGKELVEVSADGYRASRTVVRPGTEGRLDRLLIEAPSGADAGPLAAVLAAELELDGLVDRLCELVTAPNPVLAGIAKAAALRLGAHPSRAGRLSELHPFLDHADLAALRAWVGERDHPPRQS